MFEGLDRMVGCLCIMCLIFIPLGMWKLIEIIIYVKNHLHWR